MYECKLCDFSAKIKTNYTIHCESAKHKKNLADSLKCICIYCKKEFACKKYLKTHLKLCSLKSNLEMYKNQYIEDKIEQIDLLTKELKKCKKEKKEIIEKYEKQIKEIKEINKIHPNTINLLKYANNYLNKVPDLKKFESFINKEKYSAINLFEKIVIKYDNYISFFGNLIIDNYKIKLPQNEAFYQQKIWSIDRKTFIYKKDDIWIQDNGDIIIDFIIKPMVLYMQNLYHIYITALDINTKKKQILENILLPEIIFKKIENENYQYIIQYILPFFIINPLLIS